MNESSPPHQFATSVVPDPINPRVRDFEVIDTDFHFAAPWPVLRQYLKEPFKRLLHHYPATSLEYNPEPANEKPGVGQNTHGNAGTAEQALAAMDSMAVGTAILNPGYNRPQSIFNEPVLAAIASAHNDYLINEVFPVSDRIKASLMICHRDPALGAAEIRRVGHHKQFVSVYTEFSGLYEPIGNAKFDPILDAMKEFDLTLTAHSGGWFPHFTPLWTGARTWIELFGNAPAGNCMAHIAAMITQGMFDKYPDQMVVFQEGGYWWLPDLMLRLDDFYMSSSGDIALVERKLASGEKGLKKLPSEYFKSNIRFSTQPITIPKNHEHFKWLLELSCAKELLVFSTDWPHQTMDPPNWVVEHQECIPQDMQRRIFSENAKRAFKRLA